MDVVGSVESWSFKVRCISLVPGPIGLGSCFGPLTREETFFYPKLLKTLPHKT
jgi:hypothetical protein